MGLLQQAKVHVSHAGPSLLAHPVLALFCSDFYIKFYLALCFQVFLLENPGKSWCLGDPAGDSSIRHNDRGIEALR